jgi:hypothetical protein
MARMLLFSRGNNSRPSKGLRTRPTAHWRPARHPRQSQQSYTMLRHLLRSQPTVLSLNFPKHTVPIVSTNRTKSAIRACIAADIKTYEERGFTVTSIHADGECNQFRNLFPTVAFNICSAEDHVPEIERAIRTVKETVRATIHGMPNHCLPRTTTCCPMPTESATPCPPPPSLQAYRSPISHPSLRRHQQQHQVSHPWSNCYQSNRKLKRRSFFMSLKTGERIHRRSWTVLPNSDAAISRVEAIALNENMPTVDHNNMINEYDPDDIVDVSGSKSGRFGPDPKTRKSVQTVLASRDARTFSVTSETVCVSNL